MSGVENGAPYWPLRAHRSVVVGSAHVWPLGGQTPGGGGGQMAPLAPTASSFLNCRHTENLDLSF